MGGDVTSAVGGPPGGGGRWLVVGSRVVFISGVPQPQVALRLKEASYLDAYLNKSIKCSSRAEY